MTTVVEAPAPVEWLAYPNRGEIFNLVDPGFTVAELVDRVVSLVNRGDVELVRDDEESTPTEVARQTVMHLFSREGRMGPYTGYYGLTRQGGAHWESQTHPQWERFANRWTGPDLSESGIEAHDRDLVGRVLRAWPYFTDGEVVVSGSEEWRVVGPWHATYWKTLDVGHRVEFRTTRDASKELQHWVMDMPQEVTELRELISHWYALP